MLFHEPAFQGLNSSDEVWATPLDDWNGMHQVDTSPLSTLPQGNVGLDCASTKQWSDATPRGVTSNSTSPSYLRSEMTCYDEAFDAVCNSKASKVITRKKVHRCREPGCKSSFTEVRSMIRHLRTLHSKTRDILCPHAGCKYAWIGFDRHDSFLKHCRRKHKGACVRGN